MRTVYVFHHTLGFHIWLIFVVHFWYGLVKGGVVLMRLALFDLLEIPLVCDGLVEKIASTSPHFCRFHLAPKISDY